MVKEFIITYWELIVIGFLLLNTGIQKLEKIKGNSDILTWIWQFLTWIKSVTGQVISIIFSTKPGKLPMLFIGFFLMSTLAFAEPFLVCDPQTNVTHYDEAGTNVVASGVTDASGEVPFDLDAGTYYIFRQLSGWNFDNPQKQVGV